jgi:hypothetical protein
MAAKGQPSDYPLRDDAAIPGAVTQKGIPEPATRSPAMAGS